jgi:hypothetical protein
MVGYGHTRCKDVYLRLWLPVSVFWIRLDRHHFDGSESCFQGLPIRIRTVSISTNYKDKYVERCKHVKSQATTVYFRLGKLRRVSTYVPTCGEV